MKSNELDRLLSMKGLTTPADLPSIITQRIEETLLALPDRQKLVRENRRKRKWIHIPVAIALLGSIVMGVVYYYPLKTSDRNQPLVIVPPSEKLNLIRTPVVGSLINDANEKTGPSVTDQGITFMIREIVYDGYEMVLRYSISSDEELKEFMMDAKIKMDDRTIGKVGYLQSGEDKYLDHYYEKANPRHYEGIITTTSLSYSDYRPSSTQVRLNITKIGGKEGEWSLDIPVKETSEITLIRPGASKSANQGVLQVHSVSLSPVSTQISYQFNLGEIKKNSAIGVDLTDDKGFRYGGAVLNLDINDRFIGWNNYQPVSAGATALFLRPYYFDNQYERLLRDDEYYRTEMNEKPTPDNPLRLPLGEVGELYITGFEYLADKTIVYCQSENTGAGFAILDGEGKMLPILSWGSGGAVLFEPIPPDAKLTFLTRPTSKRVYIPELEIRIDLP
jgi:hypothetical protein